MEIVKIDENKSYIDMEELECPLCNSNLLKKAKKKKPHWDDNYLIIQLTCEECDHNSDLELYFPES